MIGNLSLLCSLLLVRYLYMKTYFLKRTKHFDCHSGDIRCGQSCMLDWGFARHHTYIQDLLAGHHSFVFWVDIFEASSGFNCNRIHPCCRKQDFYRLKNRTIWRRKDPVLNRHLFISKKSYFRLTKKSLIAALHEVYFGTYFLPKVHFFFWV